MPNRLTDALKSLTINAVDASQPADIFYGTVKSASPLIVSSGKLELDDDFIHICLGVYERGFSVGDTVALMRLAGGQDFLLIDKVVSI